MNKILKLITLPLTLTPVFACLIAQCSKNNDGALANFVFYNTNSIEHYLGQNTKPINTTDQTWSSNDIDFRDKINDNIALQNLVNAELLLAELDFDPSNTKIILSIFKNRFIIESEKIRESVTYKVTKNIKYINKIVSIEVEDCVFSEHGWDKFVYFCKDLTLYTGIFWSDAYIYNEISFLYQNIQHYDFFIYKGDLKNINFAEEQ